MIIQLGNEKTYQIFALVFCVEFQDRIGSLK
jgi:hypothetical protein